MSGGRWLLHAVAPARVPDDAVAAVIEAARAVRAEGLAAVISPAPEALEEPEETGAGAAAASLGPAVLAHHRLLVQLLGAGDILPVRFGTVLPAAEAAEALLVARSGLLDAALSEVAGAEEWALDLSRGPASALPPSRDTAAMSAGRARLRARLERRRRQETAERDLARAVELAWSGLGEASRASGEVRHARRENGGRRQVFLVERAARSAFLARARRCHDLVGPGTAAFRLSGPWPPYAFARWPGGREAA